MAAVIAPNAMDRHLRASVMIVPILARLVLLALPQLLPSSLGYHPDESSVAAQAWSLARCASINANDPEVDLVKGMNV